MITSVGIGFLDISALDASSFDSVIGLVLIRTITLITAYLINQYKKSMKKDFSIPKPYYFAVAMILFGTLYLFISSLENDAITLYNVMISGFILIITNVTMIVINEKIYDLMIATNEKNILEQQNIAYENQVVLISQSTENIRSLKHDMKNHLLILNELYAKNKKEEIEDYIGNILEQIEHEAFSKSNNFVIDSILNFKLNEFKNKDIDIDIDIDITLNVNIPQVINILAFDLTVILGNLLDNAITAVKQSKIKILDLSISCSRGNLIILMDNSYDGNLIIENGIFKTTKAYKTNHGTGLANIEKSLEKYGGEIRTEYTSDIFSVAVVIPFED
jgi:sensor histidine kinase regulating citrate/malate metabolism